MLDIPLSCNIDLLTCTSSFRWVEDKLNTLRTVNKAVDVDAALEHAPKNTYKTYESILGTMSQQSRPGATKEQVRTLLQWLVFSADQMFTPIQALSEVAKSIGVELEQPLDVLDLCAPLVTLTPQFDWRYGAIIRIDLMHHSLVSYILSAQTPESPASWWSCTPQEAFATIAETCLAFLRTFETKDRISPNRTAQTILRLKALEIWASAACSAGAEHRQRISRSAKAWFESPAFELTSETSPALHMVRAGLIDELFDAIELGLDPTDALLPAVYKSQRSGDWQLPRRLLQTGRIDLHKRTDDGIETISEIINMGKPELIMTALDHIDTVDEEDVRRALDCDDSTVFKATLDKWRAVNPGKLSDHALSAAIYHDKIQQVDMLLEGLVASDLAGSESVVEAFMNHDPWLRDRVIKLGVQCPLDNKMMWYRAMARDNISTIEELVIKGATIPADAVEYAVHRRKMHVLDTMAKHGVELSQLGWPNPLTAALQQINDCIPCLQHLLDLGADVSFQDENGNVLHHASA